jgi:glutamine synthetase
MKAELEAFLQEYPNTTSLEVLMVDMNGIPRCKRVPRAEFDSFFAGILTTPASTPLCNTLGDIIDTLDRGTIDGDPDGPLVPVPGTLSAIPWLKSDTAQMLSTFQLADTMGEAMAIFTPNANSYRRLVPDNFAPLAPNWGYNHRNVSLRIPVSGDKNRRIEHRTASADSNPYLVMAAVLAGIHHGLENKCDPGPMIAEGEEIAEEVISLPQHWPDALDAFDASKILPRYLGGEYCELFSIIRRDECAAFKATISNVDYQWYLRTV